MQNYTLDVLKREQMGKANVNRCRREGFIPGVAYHRHDKPVSIKVPYKEFVRLAERSRTSQVFTFKSDASELNGKSAIVKEIQRDYIGNKLLHIDFQTLKDDEVIHVQIPIKVIGESPGVKNDGGILTIVAHEVSVRCLPKNIPDFIEVDISNLGLGQNIHGSDLKLSSGVTLDDDQDETIVSVVAAKAMDLETPAAAAPAEGAAEGEAAAAEGAAAPAEEGKEAKPEKAEKGK